MGLLRILLAIAVCLSHTTQVWPYHWMTGGAAVYVFFVISGFYMQLVLATKYTPEKLGLGAVRSFYLARYLRLFPAYALALLAALGLSVYVGIKEGGLVHPLSTWQQLLGTDARQAAYAVLVAFSNLTMLGLNIPGSRDLAIGASWSLGVELGFYLLAPWLLRGRDRTLVLWVLVGWMTKLLPGNTHLPLLAGIDCFILGALAYRHRSRLTLRTRLQDKKWRASLALLVLGLTAFALPSIDLIPIGRTNNRLDTLFYPPLFALLIPTLFSATASAQIDRFVGELSYPFYIFHELVARALSPTLKGRDATMDYAFAVTAITLIAAAAVLFAERLWIEPRRAKIGVSEGAKPPGRSGPDHKAADERCSISTGTC